MHNALTHTTTHNTLIPTTTHNILTLALALALGHAQGTAPRLGGPPHVHRGPPEPGQAAGAERAAAGESEESHTQACARPPSILLCTCQRHTQAHAGVLRPSLRFPSRPGLTRPFAPLHRPSLPLSNSLYLSHLFSFSLFLYGFLFEMEEPQFSCSS